MAEKKGPAHESTGHKLKSDTTMTDILTKDAAKDAAKDKTAGVDYPYDGYEIRSSSSEKITYSVLFSGITRTEITNESGVRQIPVTNNDSLVEVLAKGFRESDESEVYELEVKTKNRKRTLTASLSDIQTQSLNLQRRLGDFGLSLAKTGRNSNSALFDYINSACLNPRDSSLFTLVNRYGWKETENGLSFRLPNVKKETGLDLIGAENGDNLRFDGDINGIPKYSQRGTLEDWQNTIGLDALHSSRAVLALCLSLAPIMLKFDWIESGGVHFYGLSSTGKTTLTKIASSVWTGGKVNDLSSWNSTSNFQEGLSASHDGFPIFLDDLSNAKNARDVIKTIYSIGNRTGRGRANRDGTQRGVSTWDTLALSTGERTIEETAKENKLAFYEGVDVRFPSIPAVTQYGIYETLPDGLDGAQLSNRFKENCSKFYGTAGKEFITRLMERIQRLGDDGGRAIGMGLKAQRANLVEHWLEGLSETDGIITRVVERLAYFATIGELAIDLGVFPWAKGEAIKSVKACLDSWMSGHETGRQKADRLAIDILTLPVTHIEHVKIISATNMDNVNHVLSLIQPLQRGELLGVFAVDENNKPISVFIPTNSQTQRKVLEAVGCYDCSKINKALAKSAYLITGTNHGGSRRVRGGNDAGLEDGNYFEVVDLVFLLEKGKDGETKGESLITKCKSSYMEGRLRDWLRLALELSKQLKPKTQN